MMKGSHSRRPFLVLFDIFLEELAKDRLLRELEDFFTDDLSLHQGDLYSIGSRLNTF